MLQHSYNFTERYFGGMKSKIISIGNSKGVIIPASFMKELGLTDALEMEVVENTLVIRPISNARLLYTKARENKSMGFQIENTRSEIRIYNNSKIEIYK